MEDVRAKSLKKVTGTNGHGSGIDGWRRCVLQGINVLNGNKSMCERAGAKEVRGSDWHEERVVQGVR